MLVRSILKTKGSDIFSVEPDATVIAVVRELKTRRIGAVLVCDPNGPVLGVLSERDIVRALADNGGAILDQPAASLMTREVVSCTPEDTIDSVMALMTDRRIRHIPVYDRDRLVGLVSIGDVVKYRIAESEMEAEAMKQYITTG